MHDIRFIRENPAAFDAGLARRGLDPQAEAILASDKAKRTAETDLQTSLARRNELSRKFGELRSQGKSLGTPEMAELQSLKVNVPQGEQEQRKSAKNLEDALAAIPNLPAEDVPAGEDESGNIEVAKWGKRRDFVFEPHEHADLGPALGMDFETGAALSGARFTFLRGGMARLHRALAQFMLDRQTGENGYTECNPPVLVRSEAMFGTGQLPKFSDDSFQTYRTPPELPQIRSLKDLGNFNASNIATEYIVPMRAFIEHNNLSDPDNFPTMWNVPSDELRAIIPGHYLIPTSEVSLTNSVREKIIDDLSQPIRLTALTPCFRSEAGAAGKDTRGFIRQHQFEKVELVSICRPQDAQKEHKHMLASAHGVLEALKLPYRTMLLCAGDMGFSAKKTFDLEVWLPGQGAYREISSISWCGDFQARRMNARYRPEGGKGTAFVHTLNGSGLAVGRTLVAVLENYQQADGSVTVPEVLIPYMGGIDRLVPDPKAR